MRARARAYALLSRVTARLPVEWRERLGRAWLTILSPDDLMQISVWSYRRGSGFEAPHFNSQGLHPWESALSGQMIAPGTSVLVAAAGAGREMIGLARLGHDVTGFDPAPDLVEAGRRHLDAAGVEGQLCLAPPCAVPPLTSRFGAVVIGAGSYHHIPTRAARIAFLKTCAEPLEPGGPLIVGSVMEDLSGRKPVASGESWPEPGGRMLEAYGRAFLEEELIEEMVSAGLDDVRVHTTTGRSAFLGSGRKPTA